MKNKFITTVASIALTVGVSGFAYAQTAPNDDQKRPANERVEKRAPVDDAAQKRVDDKRAGEAAPDVKKADEKRAAQADPAEKRMDEKRVDDKRMDEKQADEKRAAQADPAEKRMDEKRVDEKRVDDKRMDQKRVDEKRVDEKRADEKRVDEKRVDQADVGEKRLDDKRKAASDNAEKRAEDKRADQAEQTERRDDAKAVERADRKELTAAERAHDVRVEGNIHISEERAARISDELMRRGARTTLAHDVEIGATLTEDVVLTPLPPEIVEFAPEYRGYDYIYTNNQIVFVQPDTHEVVGMIAMGGNTVAANNTTEPRLSRPKPCPVD